MLRVSDFLARRRRGWLICVHHADGSVLWASDSGFWRSGGPSPLGYSEARIAGLRSSLPERGFPVVAVELRRGFRRFWFDGDCRRVFGSGLDRLRRGLAPPMEHWAWSPARGPRSPAGGSPAGESSRGRRASAGDLPGLPLLEG